MKTKEFKKTKGITLISLVVTIVVLLILAGISIVTLTGENGIITRAQRAKETTEVAKFREAAQLAYMEAYTDNAKNGGYTVDIADVVAKLVADQPEYNGKITDATGGTVIAIEARIGEKVVNEANPVVIAKNGEKTIAIVPTFPTGTGGAKYVELDGKYYLVTISGGEVVLGEGTSEPPTVTNKLEIENEESLQNIGAEIIENTLQVKITTGTTETDENIVIKYGG